jgi:hypothetical protein
MPVLQSALALQARPCPQGGHTLPPQSMSVSLPFLIMSAQEPLSSWKSTPTVERPFRTMVIVTLTGGLTVTVAGVGALAQFATAPAAGGQAPPKPSPVNVSLPTGSPFSGKTVLCPGITGKFCTTVRAPATVMRMQFTSLGAALTASVATPTKPSEPSLPELQPTNELSAPSPSSARQTQVIAFMFFSSCRTSINSRLR